MDIYSIESPTLRALTTAALALPGLASSFALHADEGGVGFQYGYYQEGQRNLYGDPTPYRPIQVESIQGSGSGMLQDRVTFNFNYLKDTWSGATPMATAPYAFGGNRGQSDTIATASPMIRPGGYVDKKFRPYALNSATGTFSKDNRLVHTLSSASPETRTQGGMTFGYQLAGKQPTGEQRTGGQWDNAMLHWGAGISEEPDYDSRWIHFGGAFDFNGKMTRLNMEIRKGNSESSAKFNPAARPYIDLVPEQNRREIIKGARQDGSFHLGLTQILNKNSVGETHLDFSRATGDLENPYKVVEWIFVDPKQEPFNFGTRKKPLFLRQADVHAVLEQRPDKRDQWSWDTRYLHYIKPLNAAWHLGYQLSRDDWGITAHTLSTNWEQPITGGWMITPSLRYYSQSAAHFYRPYYLFKRSAPLNAFGQLKFNKIPIHHYSSDQRLSSYEAWSGGFTVSRQFSKGVKLELGMEYYTHRDNLTFSNSDPGYANFDFYTINALLGINLPSTPSSFNFAGESHSNHSGQDHHSRIPAPSGVLLNHTLTHAGDFMVSYHYMLTRQGEKILQGGHIVNDSAVVAHGCGKDNPCSVLPEKMTMRMYMLDIMYAPTNWLNVMIMPQFVDMEMPMRFLGGENDGGHSHGGAGGSSGGMGDTGIHALIQLHDSTAHHVHLGLGFGVPTGEAGKTVIVQDHTGTLPKYLHYDMQLGSGTWDFKPSLTYIHYQPGWSWGGQINGVMRISDHNAAGYALGDLFQATLWAGYSLKDGLSGSLRGVYTWQDRIAGQYDNAHEDSGPMDFPGNHGGQYWEIGLGVNAKIKNGMFHGNHFALEWLHPVHTNVNGYQLEPQGTLSASWSLTF